MEIRHTLEVISPWLYGAGLLTLAAYWSPLPNSWRKSALQKLWVIGVGILWAALSLAAILLLHRWGVLGEGSEGMVSGRLLGYLCLASSLIWWGASFSEKFKDRNPDQVRYISALLGWNSVLLLLMSVPT